MKITFLGTNGWYDTATGNTTSALIETDKCYIVLDAGGGFYKVRNIVKKDKPVYLFISHLHLDHIIGLHTLPLFNIPGGIDIYMPQDACDALKIFLNKPYTSDPASLATKIRMHAIDTGGPQGLKVEFAKLLHSPTCYGFRFHLEGRTIAYCTDTGVCDGLRSLAKDCDILIAECSFKPGEDIGKAAHLNPEVAAQIAKDSGVKQLALMHFDAGRYPTIEARLDAEKAAKKIFPNTFAAMDGRELELTSSAI